MIAFFTLYTKNTMIKEEKEIIKLDDGREITLTTGKLLDYLMNKDIIKYRELVKDLGLRR